jgi:hypothetical protein
MMLWVVIVTIETLRSECRLGRRPSTDCMLLEHQAVTRSAYRRYQNLASLLQRIP